MKFHRIQLIYLIVATALVLSFTAAGAKGFRVFSAFAVTSWVHSTGSGVHHK